jgi:hypothetical protein
MECGAQMYVSDKGRERSPVVRSTRFDEGEMFAVESALTLYLAHARNELAKDPAAPFSGAEESIESIRMKLYYGLSGHAQPASVTQTQTNLLPRFMFNAALGVLECAVLDEALTFYQACREGSDAYAPWDEFAESAREKLRPNFIRVVLEEDL